MRDLARLPKAHLHLHLEGAMRPTTLAELATGAGIEVPPIRGYGSFTAFSDMYVAACEVLRTEADVRRMVDEVVADAAADGAAWVEPATYVPRYRDALGADDRTVEVLLDELAQAGARHGVGTGLVVAADRGEDPAEAVQQAELAVRHVRSGVVGFGLHNDEAGHPPEPFAEAFDVARGAGLLSVPHAGELDGPASVRGALAALGADRVQHGVRAVEDPALVALLAHRGTCLDVCPTSNLLLGVVPSLSEHPLPALLSAGVRCSLNADDPLLFGPGLLAEYDLARSEMGLDDEVLAEVARTSIESSGAPDSLKVRVGQGIDAWLTAPASAAS